MVYPLFGPEFMLITVDCNKNQSGVFVVCDLRGPGYMLSEDTME